MAGAYSSAYSSAFDSGAGGTTGTLAVIQAPQSSTATGTILNPITGTVAVTQANQIGLAQGSFPVTGTSTTFQAAQTSTATGTVGVSVTGTLAVTQAAQTSTAVGGTGTSGVSGTVAYTQPSQSSASAGATWTAAGGIPGQAVDGGLRFEAFRLPDHPLGFGRKFDLSRWISGFTVAEKWDQISDAAFNLKSDFPRLADFMTVDQTDHANDVGSIVRVLRGQTPVMHYMCKQRDDTWSADSNVIPCHLEGMEYFMDKATVPRYDYPAKPSLDPDHIYGAKSILRTIGGETTNELVEIWTDATSGAGSLTFGAETTGPLDWNATSGDVKTLLEALTNIVTVDVSGSGDGLNPWTIEFIDPAGDVGTVTANQGTLNAALNRSVIANGGTLSPRPWHESFNPVTQLTHGTYEQFEIVTTPVPAGDTYALAVDGGPPVFASDYSGCQLIVEVTPGRTYRASIPVRSNTGTEVFRFVIRDMSENLIAATPDTTIGTTYTTMSIPTLKIPAGVTQIIYRVGIISAGNPGKVFVGIESALLAPGQEAAPFGKIMWDLFDLVQAAGRLTWLVPTFTDTHDSAGVLWDRNLEWAVKRRQSLWQLCEYAKRWFYLNRVRWNDSAGVFNWDAFNPNGGGTNYDGTGLAISGRTGVTSSGVISHRAPEATYYDAEGDGGQWGEFEDVTLTGAWGPLDKYYPNRQGLDSAGLDILAERLVDDAATRTEGIVIRLEAPTALPWDRFRPGDIVTINLGPKQPKQLLRCMAVVASQGPDDSHPAYDTHWGSVVYQGEAATAHMLRTLWRKFETLDMFDPPATVDPAGGGCCPSCITYLIGSGFEDTDGVMPIVWNMQADPDILMPGFVNGTVNIQPRAGTYTITAMVSAWITIPGPAVDHVDIELVGHSGFYSVRAATTRVQINPPVSNTFLWTYTYSFNYETDGLETIHWVVAADADATPLADLTLEVSLATVTLIRLRDQCAVTEPQPPA